MTNLTKYDAARYALQAAITVDEVKDIRDKSEAMAAYARQAKDVELIKWATEIKVRAERKAGQLLADIPKVKGGNPNFATGHTMLPVAKTLEELGVTKNESSRWQKLAAVSDSQFEEAVASAKEVAGEVTTAALIRYEKSLHKPTESVMKITPKVSLIPLKELATPENLDYDLTAEEEAEALAEIESEELAEKATLAAFTKARLSDDPLAEMTRAFVELQKHNKVIESRMNGMMNERDQFIKKIARLERQLKATAQLAA